MIEGILIIFKRGGGGGWISIFIVAAIILGIVTGVQTCKSDIKARYELVNRALSWTDAKFEAERRGGHLAVIRSGQEQTTIENLIAREGNMQAYWIGGYCGNDRIWRWLNNELVKYTNWGSGEPNNYQGKQDRMRINRVRYAEVGFGKWDDDDNIGRNENGFIIEW
jgi:hypothetical protein